MAYDIFISYRREGGDTLAQLVYDRLSEKGYSVFLDIESLRSGKFNEKLFSVIDECKDVVVILPPNALERCEDPEDWVFMELNHSLKRGKNIVPIMMKGFSWPEKMPEGLEELPNFNGIQDSKDYFDAVIAKLMTLLKSKKGVLNPIRKKLREKRKKYQNTGVLKKIIGAVILLLILCAAAGGVYGYQKYRENERIAREEQTVHITLIANEEMSAGEYSDAVEIIKERFDILAGETPVEYEVDGDQLNVATYLDVFGGNDIEYILKGYISRPSRLYFEMYNGMQQRIQSVESGDVEKIEYKKGSCPEIDPEKYEVDITDEYYYTEITFTEDFAEKIELPSAGEVDFRLIQDYEEFEESGNWYYYSLTDSGDGRTFYYVDNLQNEKICELNVHNYRNETFSKAFSFQIQRPIRWEKIKEAEIKGEQQCDVDELSGPLITIQYIMSSEDVTEGAYHDAVTAIKRRLDTLDRPYAFGYLTEDEKSVSVKLSPERLGKDMMEMLVSNNFLEISAKYYELFGESQITEANCVQRDDGSYVMELEASEYALDNARKNLEIMDREENQNIYLLGIRGMLASMSLEEGVVGDRFYIDNLSCWGIDTIGKEEAFMFSFLKELLTGLDYPSGVYYTMNSVFAENMENEEWEILPVELTRTEEALRAIAEELGADVKISVYSDWISADVTVKSEDFIKDAEELARELYKGGGFMEDSLWTLRLTCRDSEGNGVTITFRRELYKKHCTTYDVSGFGDKGEAYEEAYLQLAAENPFYQETVQPED